MFMKTAVLYIFIVTQLVAVRAQDTYTAQRQRMVDVHAVGR